MSSISARIVLAALSQINNENDSELPFDLVEDTVQPTTHNTKCDENVMGNVTSELREDDDDSIKDPNFDSSSTSSCCSSKSSTNFSSSTSEEDKTIEKQVPANRIKNTVKHFVFLCYTTLL